MTPDVSLDRCKTYLDEATENLTFDEFRWALEEASRGYAWALNALRDTPSEELDLRPKGDLPRRASLETLRDDAVEVAGAEALAERIDALLEATEHARDVDGELRERAEQVEQCVFDVWQFLDACREHLGLTEEPPESAIIRPDPAFGGFDARGVDRRTAMKLLLAGGLAPLQACDKPKRTRGASKSAAKRRSAAKKTPTADVKSVTPLGGMHWNTSDPFLFCAHHYDKYPAGNENMGPDASLAGRHLGRDFDESNKWRMYHGRQVPGFPRHPHRGFETVTVVRTGRLDHSDSLGATARYGGGDVQWLTAGGGIQHAEMFPLLDTDAPNPLELFQIWLNLPAADKMVDPYFRMLWSEDIPRVVERDSRGKVVELTLAAGSYKGEGPPAPPPNSWASKAKSDLAIWSIRMEPGARFTLPQVEEGTERSLYVHRGDGLQVGDAKVPHARRVELDGHGSIGLEAGRLETEIVLLQGRPIGEPVAKRGPFVMNTQQEIRQAYADYRRTQFGGWPWSENGPVHTRQKGRFARHIDGSFEEPT